MARLARLALSQQPHHIMQRGNNGQPIFVDAADRERLLAWVGEGALRFHIALHAYVLTDNEFHLLATPATADALPKWMQAIGRSYVRYFNDRHGRSGTLWDGRYRSTLVQAERYLLPCMAFIDLQPVRSGLVAQPLAHGWSSHAHYVGQRHDRLVTPHALYWTMGNTPFEREAAYADLVRAGLSAADEALLADAISKGWVAGDAHFVAKMQSTTVRRLSRGNAGRRPSKAPD